MVVVVVVCLRVGVVVAEIGCGVSMKYLLEYTRSIKKGRQRRLFLIIIYGASRYKVSKPKLQEKKKKTKTNSAWPFAAKGGHPALSPPQKPFPTSIGT